MTKTIERLVAGGDAKRLTRGEADGLPDFDTIGRQPVALD